MAPRRSRAPPAALAELDRVGPKTVVWLNEAHHYLLHPDHGEQIATALCAFSSQTQPARPFWSWALSGQDYFDELITTPPPARSEHVRAHRLCAPPEEP